MFFRLKIMFAEPTYQCFAQKIAYIIIPCVIKKKITDWISCRLNPEVNEL